MARKSSNRKINQSEYNVGQRYKLSDIEHSVIPSNKNNGQSNKVEVLTGNDLEQMMGAYLDDQNTWTLNINSTFYAINIPNELFSKYTLTSDLHWPTISYNIYGTTRLAWLLMKLNGIKDGNIFNIIKSGTTIRYLDKTRYVDTILSSLAGN